MSLLDHLHGFWKRLTLLLLVDVIIIAASSSQLSTVRASTLSSELVAVLKSLNNTQATYNASLMLSTIESQATPIDSLAENSHRRDSHSNVACRISRIVFGSSKYIDASSPIYVNETDMNWSQNCWLPAACITEVHNVVDVAIILRIVTFFGSKFAVRSGGLNPNPGFGSIDRSGVLIDVGNMNALQISADHKSVIVGPGARWGEVYNYLDPYGVSAIGGRSPVPAVSGFLTGGGLPYIPSLYGLGCDNVKSFEIVLGNSTVIQASATSKSDLFFALKGGGPNYGITTRYDLYTVPLHHIWYKFDLYNQSDYKAILAATIHTQTLMEDDPNADFIWVAANGTILIGLMYAGWIPKPVVFEAFYPLTTVSSFIPETNGTVYALSQGLNLLYTTAATRDIVGVTVKTDLELYQQAFTRYLTVSNFTSSKTADQSFVIQPIGRATVAAGKARGGNPLGLSAAKQNWFNSVAQFTLPADEKPAQNAINTLQSTLQQLAKAKGLLLPYIFQNDANGVQNPLASYGVENLRKLKEASREYDPEQVFQRLQFGGFKVSGA